jgi:hypothetical protein
MLNHNWQLYCVRSEDLIVKTFTLLAAARVQHALIGVEADVRFADSD